MNRTVDDFAHLVISGDDSLMPLHHSQKIRNTSVLHELIPRRRSLESWLELSKGYDRNQWSTKVTIVQGLGGPSGGPRMASNSGAYYHHSKMMARMPAYHHDSFDSQCININ